MKQLISRHKEVLIAISSGFIGWIVGKKSVSKENVPFHKTEIEIFQPPSDKDNEVLTRTREIMKYGFPSLENIRTLSDYVLAYDGRCKIPYWTFEHLMPKDKEYKADRALSDFVEDQSFHEYFRSTNQDYKGSGYDRGHLAAAGNHRKNQKVCDETFFLSNIAPQVGTGFNRDYWVQLEKRARKLAFKNKNVYICTGPLFLPYVETNHRKYVKYEVIGNNNVAVPTHFFKVILIENNNGQFEMESYVVPNMPIPETTPLSKFYMPVSAIEHAAGFLLFSKLPRDRLSSVNGAKVSTNFISNLIKGA